MKGVQEILDGILADIKSLANPKIEKERIPQLHEFIKSTINGDQAKEYLTIDANLGENKQGYITYILTDVRLIKIDIDSKEVQSASYVLESIVSIERKLINPDRAEVNIQFQNDSFGLRYSQKDQKITDFFQKVDQARIPKEGSQRGTS